MAIRFTDTTPKAVDKKSVAPASEKKAIAEKALVSDQKADEFFGHKPKGKAKSKDMISIRLDPDVLEHFRSTGPGWQGRINDILRKHVL